MINQLRVHIGSKLIVLIDATFKKDAVYFLFCCVSFYRAREFKLIKTSSKFKSIQNGLVILKKQLVI